MRSLDVSSASLEDLERAARAKDAAAMTELGKRSLVGRAGLRTPHDGAELLAAAAEAGDAEADALIAVLIGVDAATPADWNLALGYLERSAYRGWQPARDQLTLLCSDCELAGQWKNSSAPRDI